MEGSKGEIVIAARSTSGSRFGDPQNAAGFISDQRSERRVEGIWQVDADV